MFDEEKALKDKEYHAKVIRHADKVILTSSVLMVVSYSYYVWNATFDLFGGMTAFMLLAIVAFALAAGEHPTALFILPFKLITTLFKNKKKR